MVVAEELFHSYQIVFLKLKKYKLTFQNTIENVIIVAFIFWSLSRMTNSMICYHFNQFNQPVWIQSHTNSLYTGIKDRLEPSKDVSCHPRIALEDSWTALNVTVFHHWS